MEASRFPLLISPGFDIALIYNVVLHKSLRAALVQKKRNGNEA